ARGSPHLLATGHRDSTALLWDVSGLRTRRPVALPGTGPAEQWASLLDDAEKAFKAQRALAAAGSAGVAAIGKRLRPATDKVLDVATLARLVQELDDDEFAVRRKAFAALAEAGKSAAQQLRLALAGNPSAEVKRRVRELLGRLGRHGASGEELRAL